jgi:hypothetical protein
MNEREKAVAAITDELLKLQREWADKGQVIAGGAAMFEALFLTGGTLEAQRNDMRVAFTAGAEYIFSTMMSIMDGGDEMSDKDLSRMDAIHKEVEVFREFMRAHIAATGRRKG